MQEDGGKGRGNERLASSHLLFTKMIQPTVLNTLNIQGTLSDLSSN